MTLKHWFLLTTLSLLWGGSFLLGRIGVAEIPPLTLVFFRVCLAAATLHVVLIMRGQRFPVSPRLLGAFMAMGVLNNAIPFSLIFWGQTALSASLSSILNATTPIFTALVATFVFSQEALQPHRLLGILIGFAGVAILLMPGLAGVESAPLWAQMLCLGAALSYAFAAVIIKRFKDIPVLIAATGQLTASSALMLPLAVWQAVTWSESVWSPSATSLHVWLAVIALGTICTALAYLIFFRLIAETGATNTSLVTLLVPVSASVLGALVLNESLTLLQFGGMLLLLLGLIVLDGRIPRRVLGLGEM